MIKKIILSLIIVSLLIGCKDNTSKQILKKETTIFDTIFYETDKKVDTFLLKTTKTGESLWINKMYYKKEIDDNFFLIASSLSHNGNTIQIDNYQGTIHVKDLGSDVSFQNKKFKDYDFIIVQDSTYNSGNLYKTVNTFLINKNGVLLKNEEFNLKSKDKGKTYDKELKIVSERDSIYLQ